MRTRITLLSLLTLLVACDPGGDDGTSLELGDCPDGAATWVDVEPIFAAYCTDCHSATLTGAGRQGAPATLNYDTEPEAGSQPVSTWSAIASGVMPPAGGGPSDEEAASLREFLSCAGG